MTKREAIDGALHAMNEADKLGIIDSPFDSLQASNAAIALMEADYPKMYEHFVEEISNRRGI